MLPTLPRQTWAWAFYDWANSAFATVVIAGFFPVFFREYWSRDVASSEITFHLGLANSAASVAIVVLAPVLGAIADSAGIKKRLLLLFATLGIAMTGAFFWLAAGEWQMAALLYVFASIGFMGGNVFYDSLLVNVAEQRHYDFVSAFGYALGYLGGGLLFAFCVAMTIKPAWFGLSGAAEAVRLSFLLTAVWWALFSLPVLLWVQEPKPLTRGGLVREIAGGFAQLYRTFHEIRRLRVLSLFLLAYWLYIDGVDTVIRMAVDYGLSLGFGTNQLITALLITQFVGFPAAVVFGRLGERYGTKRSIEFGIAVFIVVTILGSMMQKTWHFYAIAVIIGLVLGGVQSLSRSFYARMIPAGKSAEFFGFYNMLGKFAAVIGPALMGGAAVLTGDQRLAILSLLILFVAGGVLLYFVDEQAGIAAAKEL
ncbi:MAG: MFS transporter [Gammaproteobacteria bacterium]